MRVIKARGRTSLGAVGVYKVMYGEKFYIGYSSGIPLRLYNHGREVTKALNNPEPVPDFHYLFKVVNHLNAHPEITDGVAYIIEYCEEDQLIQTEQKWLTHYKDDPNCLNMGFIAKPGSGDVRKMNLKK